VLANGAVAMTGGQPIEGEALQGEITVPEIARQLAAEGVKRIAVVSNEPDKYPRDAGFPSGVSFHHRDAIDPLQRELRAVPGVSALIYDQTCAAEARRLRKRDAFPDPDRRIVINELVCEGCGDCSVQSNCISIEPVETEFGRKRRINQSSCNKDYSCVKGYCPSFVSVYGGRVRKAGEAGRAASETRAESSRKAGEAGRAASKTRAELDRKAGEAGRAASETRAESSGHDAVFATLPTPPVADTTRPFNVLVAGIGGSGVVTAGALLGMAAHLEGKGCSVLDVTGLAQKNGPVTSHVRVADDPESLHATRIAAGSADLLVGADVVVAASAQVLPALSRERTTAVVDTRVAPTFEFALDPDLDLSSRGMEQALTAATREKDAHFVAASRLATALLGDAIGANLFLLGYALQRGRLPVGLGALERAIELNGRAVALNKRALAWGRLAAHDLEVVQRVARPALRDGGEGVPASLEEIVARRVEFLTRYQSRRYARRYRALVELVAERERSLGSGTPLAEAVARYYFKLLAYKDEYEVARLYSDGSFHRQLESEFEGDYRLELHLAPQLFPRDSATGRVRKVAVGGWIFPAFRLLAKLRFLRGTPLDPFGRTAHRRLERELVRDYEASVETLLDGLDAESRELAVAIASLPEQIRGFDVVKERHLEQVREKQAELLAAFRGPRAANAS
jgi:indolepyruvate ferredoxin oxidoreductase